MSNTCSILLHNTLGVLTMNRHKSLAMQLDMNYWMSVCWPTGTWLPVGNIVFGPISVSFFKHLVLFEEETT